MKKIIPPRPRSTITLPAREGQVSIHRPKNFNASVCPTQADEVLRGPETCELFVWPEVQNC